MILHLGYRAGLLLSACIALLLCIYPLPAHYAWFRPEFMTLLCIFWAMYSPYRFGVVTAWSLGLLQDMVVGGVWGAHAIGLAFVAYLCLSSYQRLRSYHLGQQTLWVFVMVGVHQIFVNWVHGLAGYQAPAQMIVLPALVTALCWPLAVLILKPSRPAWQV